MKILHMDFSPREESHSRKLSAAIVARLFAIDHDACVIRRDLGQVPIPHTEAGYAAVLSSPTALTSEQSSVATVLSEELIQEVEDADVLVIGTPMHNFTVPSVLKAWIDQILRMGRTIGASPTGEKFGLLQDKPVYIGIASGGVFTGDRAKQPDFLKPYLIAAFGCIGLTSLQFFPLQATAFLDSDQLMASQNALITTMDTMKIDSRVE
ncbi:MULTISPECIES: FMN-dependent NADH-azoreductase [Pandoraea]|uniref:FMN dependent NADH:quinone oxidoreductase n=1 Tax=Pandoraea cepalis TaxID=2508294 RepID=A0A5E4RED2_9BURK|nr:MULTISPECIES: NAD(P)H-dependent oxidoreductase [Pandoraea]QBC30078.1 flavodoxin family protein [Pandoraea sp. XY-2]VVD60882.1 FMN-dependent NADH-azoreductase [Pandoraea cepalis]